MTRWLDGCSVSTLRCFYLSYLLHHLLGGGRKEKENDQCHLILPCHRILKGQMHKHGLPKYIWTLELMTGNPMHCYCAIFAFPQEDWADHSHACPCHLWYTLHGAIPENVQNLQHVHNVATRLTSGIDCSVWSILLQYCSVHAGFWFIFGHSTTC